MLTSLILKIFVPGMKGEPDPHSRIRCGIVSGITGIVCNVLLVIVKLTLAIVSGSIAIGADAVNNLSDAGSGIITALGFRISGTPPDAEHPFGHGRIEYVAGLTVALLIVGLGISFLKDSVISIFRPGKLNSDTVTIVIFGTTILVKCWLFLFYRKIAKLLRSDVIRAAAYDSLSDCLGSGIVVAALIASRYTDFPVDGCAGVIVAVMILRAGGSVLKDTVSKLLGEPPPPDLVDKLKNVLLNCPGIDGVHDIIIHNYGESSYYVTAHAEIVCEGSRLSAHDILENAEVAVGKKLPIHLLLHGDPYSRTEPEIILWRSRIENAVAEVDSDLKLYDFRIGKDPAGNVNFLGFHLLIGYSYGMTEAELKELLRQKMAVFNSGITLDIFFFRSSV